MNLKSLLKSYRMNNLVYSFTGRMSVLISCFRKHGITIGENCNIYSNIITREPYLISIGNDVTIAGGVTFLTHDNSVSKIFPNMSLLVGRIKIGNNVFIGAGSIILPGVHIGSGTIVGAGSVVTKSFGDNLVIGGNPAKVIRVIDSDYKERLHAKAFSTDSLTYAQKKELLLSSSDKFILKKHYFLF